MATTFARYSLAIVLVGLALALRQGIIHTCGIDLPRYIIFYPTVTLTLILADLGPGLLATALSAIAADYLMIPPLGHASIANAADIITFCIFIGMCSLLCIVFHRYRRTQLDWRNAFFEAHVDSALDGVLVVDNSNHKIIQNQRFNDLLHIPPHIAQSQDDSLQLDFSSRLMKSPHQFLERIQHLYHHPDEISRDELELLDGRTLERYSSPVKDKRGRCFGRIWTFRDISGRKNAEAALRNSLESLQEAQAIGSIGSYSTDIPRGTWTSSEVMNRIFGIGPEFTRSIDGWIHLIHPDDRAMMVQYLEDEVIHQGKPFDKEYRIVRQSDQAVRWVHGLGRLEFDSVGHPVHMTGVIQDITDRKQILDALQTSEALYRKAFQMNPDCISVSQMNDGTYLDVNNAFLQILGYQRNEVIGRTSMELGLWESADDRNKIISQLEQTSSCRDVELKFRKRNGESIFVIISASVIELHGKPCLFAITRDISATKKAESRIKHLAFYDSLTGLPNRTLLSERLQRSIVLSSRTRLKQAILFIDLDNFKTINDTHGHHLGDLQLQQVAARLLKCVRESDTVSRLGGDEFVVMLENLSESPEDAATQAKAVGHKILAAISQPYILDGHEYHSTCSIGVNVFGSQVDDEHDILKQADIAMYQAKSAGRNTLRFFAPALQAIVNSRAQLEQELRDALAAQQFLLLYQPQIERDCVVGAEALVRWLHPRRGLVPPAEFIPIAEETGLILPLGEWVLRTACEQIAPWADRPDMAHFKVSVNISARQFRQPDFVENILIILDRTHAHPRNLKLEITESMLLDNVDDVIGKMDALKTYGISFSLDDFGTGYSSLSYLKRLPFSQLKIDRSFVHDILTDAGSSAIAKSIISMGHAMDMSVIAEGVETDAQLQFLTHLGCHSFQGFLFGHPAPWHEFQQLLPALVAQ